MFNIGKGGATYGSDPGVSTGGEPKPDLVG